MEEIFSLIQCLTSREWESLQSYLTCFSTHANDEGGLKQLQLARILREETVCPAETRCCLKIYGVKEKESFERLRLRLKEKTLDFLLTDISCDKKQELDEMDYAIVRMKKKSAQFQQLYYSKKRIPLMFYLLDDVINEAKEYEQYPILIEHLKAKKNLVSWKQGKTEFEKTNEEIKDAAKRLVLYNKAEHYYYELGLVLEYEGRQNEKKKLSFLQKAIAEIKTENRDIKSPHVNYSLKFLELEYYQLKNNYTKARSICTEWLDIVLDNKSVYRRQRLGIVYDNLSRCEYYLNDYTQAAKDAHEAQKYFNAGSENYCIALEQEFYALFAQEKYNEAIDLAEKMISSATRKELGEFRDAKYHYLLANALFKKERFREALNLLSQERELAKDKAGWETGRRTMQIMTLVDMNQLDEASLAVHSLKQFFKRADKKTPVSPRDKIILKLLQMAERKGFIFNTLHGSADKYMEALQGTGDRGQGTGKSLILNPKSLISLWEPFTHEVFPFHEWFAGKMKKKILSHSAQSDGVRIPSDKSLRKKSFVQVAREERKKVVSL